MKVLVAVLPKCDFCPDIAHFDCKTKFGCWANMCPACRKKFALHPDLGVGKGQELVMKGVESIG